MQLGLQVERWAFKHPFRITGYTFTEAQVLVVTLRDGRLVGRGEASGVYYHQETPAGMVRQIESVRGQVEAGIDRAALLRLLPPGGARNALDCACWDLEAKRSGVPVWQAAGVRRPAPLRTTLTVSADVPDRMAEAAAAYTEALAIKVKLTGDAAAACVRAVREARPDCWIGVDANQAFTRRSLEALLPTLIAARVGLIEQPLPIGADAALAGLGSPIPIAADESVQDSSDIERLAPYYDVINIKLDKCGGLTEALVMAQEARRLGRKLMVGCMNGTSLAMAPGFVLGQLCDFVDLDSPTFLARDREPSAEYRLGNICCADAVWGAATQDLHQP